jgi:hypothetical protein
MTRIAPLHKRTRSAHGWYASHATLSGAGSTLMGSADGIRVAERSSSSYCTTVVLFA